jgi:hypothetical protein
MKKIRVTGVQILTPSMRFLNTFFNFSKLISSLKAQVCNILKNHIDIKIFIFINKGSRARTKVLPTVPNLPSNDEITRFDGTFIEGLGHEIEFKYVDKNGYF